MRRFLILIALLGGSPLASAAELRDLRLWDSPDSTRLVFDLNGEVQHKVFTLDHPDRVVIDISNIDRKSAADLINKAAVKGVVTKLRYGARDDGATRVVLEVSKPVMAIAWWSICSIQDLPQQQRLLPQPWLRRLQWHLLLHRRLLRWRPANRSQRLPLRRRVPPSASHPYA